MKKEILKLKPCPFCGYQINKSNFSYEITDKEKYNLSQFFYVTKYPIVAYRISCPCGCVFEKQCLSFNEFAYAWNTRS